MRQRAELRDMLIGNMNGHSVEVSSWCTKLVQKEGRASEGSWGLAGAHCPRGEGGGLALAFRLLAAPFEDICTGFVPIREINHGFKPTLVTKQGFEYQGVSREEK